MANSDQTSGRRTRQAAAYGATADLDPWAEIGNVPRRDADVQGRQVSHVSQRLDGASSVSPLVTTAPVMLRDTAAMNTPTKTRCQRVTV
jgi:hypothetical protein